MRNSKSLLETSLQVLATPQARQGWLGGGGTPLLRGILFSDRTRLLKFKNRSESKIRLLFLRLRLTAVTHSGIKDAINRILPCLK